MADARTIPEPAPLPSSGPSSGAATAPPAARPDRFPPPDQPATGRLPQPESGLERAAAKPVPPPRYPAQAVAGLAELWGCTQGGDPGITIGVIDGLPRLSHPSLVGADLRLLPAWWQASAEPDAGGVEHGTWTASVLAGRPGSILPGLAPRCRTLVVGTHADAEHSNDPISIARAIDELAEAGADLIQVTPAFHTASDDADDFLKRSVARAIEAGIVITAPAGNDYGTCSIAVANLPGVLAVGAHRADGHMFSFSNHGPAYAGHGLSTLGEAVYGAHPEGGINAQKGTCVAVALITGAAALLLALQRRLGHPPNPPAIRDALLTTARPCTPAQAHGRIERCLNGYLDLPAATAHLFPGLPPLRHEPAPQPPQLQPRARLQAHPPTIAPVSPPQPTVASHTVPPQATVATHAERPDLAGLRPPKQEPELPFLKGNMAGRWAALTGLQQRFPQFTLIATDPDGAVVGSGQAVPFALHTPERGHLPDSGWDELLTWAYADLQVGTPPDALAALGIWVAPGQRGTGLADRLLAAMKSTARTAGLDQVAAPVRPTRKHHEPATPMAAYARRIRADGLPADPWLRTHVRAGGRITGIAPASMTVTGSLAQWRTWTGLPFDTDGPVTVPGALVPVHCSLAHDHATYTEPNIWVRHCLH
ncbi:S8 family serine peptidase [Streptosporangium sp. NPDC002544]|uniref:S8 family serine peptidase n=1 Tax=Streptosporangium sp. NPDC002544 TaxID=3154538 RepID=UPI00331B22CE